jgi:hypothetical protein
MGITLSKIANNTASVAVQYVDDIVNVVYFPSHVTEKTFADLQNFSNTDSSNIIANFAQLNALLVGLIKSWDVFEDDAQAIMFPLTVDRLAELPIMFRMNILTGILGDIRPETIAPKALN